MPGLQQSAQLLRLEVALALHPTLRDHAGCVRFAEERPPSPSHAAASGAAAAQHIDVPLGFLLVSLIAVLWLLKTVACAWQQNGGSLWH